MSQRLIPTGEQIWIADAHRGDGKRFIVHADEKLTAFLELESAIRARLPNLASNKIGLSNPIFAARQPSRAKRNRAEKLSSRHREPDTTDPIWSVKFWFGNPVPHVHT